MDYKDEEPLEAGEDGAFDLGNTSLTTKHEPPRKADVMSKDPDCQTASSRGKGDDCERVEQEDLGEDVGGASEEFEDAKDVFRPELPRDVGNVDAEEIPETSSASEKARGKGHLQGASEVPVVDLCQAEHAGTESKKGPRIIAEGLSNVRLPMAYPREARLSESCPEEGTYDDSEGETEFHDALDTDGGVTKDANKAREMKETGNGYYKAGNYEDAVDYYTMALEYCPEGDEHRKEKVVYLANRAQAHLQLREFDDVVFDCTAALELDPSYVKALLRRAHANEQLEKYDLALEDTKTLVEMDPNSRSAKDVARLEKLQAEKSEKMKEEAIGKLKELGNSLLGNFGLSLDNFKMVQDPNTGSYSINFER